jgi:hypothetical protein
MMENQNNPKKKLPAYQVKGNISILQPPGKVYFINFVTSIE